MSNKNYNKTIAALWTTKSGNFLSMKFDDKTLENIKEFARSAEPGAKLIIKNLSDETRSKFKGGVEKAPNAFLELMSAASVAEYEAKNPRQRNNGVGGI